MEEVRLGLKLHPNQQSIHESNARFKVIKAGKRFGKTKWALFEIAQKAAAKPGGLFWYTAPTYRQAKSIAWIDLKQMIPRRMLTKCLENDLTMQLTQGARIELKGEDNQDTLRGTAIDGLVRDEVAQSTDYACHALRTS